MKTNNIKKNAQILLLILMIGTGFYSNAQSVILESQAEVDAFDPSTTEVNGILQIGINGVGMSDITDLSNLANITTVTEDLSIRQNQNLTNIDDLNNITTVGKALRVYTNPKLVNLDGLSNLVDITTPTTQIDIASNEILINIDALSNITDLTNLIIRGNPTLESLAGLSGITSVFRSVTILDNDALVNLDGLDNLSSATFWDLDKVTIEENDNLLNIDALNNLSPLNGTIIIDSNASLENVDGLSNQTSIGGSLEILSNDNLTNLDGLINLGTIGIDLVITNNAKLQYCCGIQELVANKETTVVGNVTIQGNPSECSTEDEVAQSGCGLRLMISTNSPCVNSENGAIQVFVSEYDTIPFLYEWMRQEDGLTGNGVSESDAFIIELLGAGTYNLTVTNASPDSAVLNDIVLAEEEGLVFEIVELNTTNSSNGMENGSITVTTAGGVPPYKFSWSGVASGDAQDVVNNFHTIPSLGFGEYLISVEDNSGASKLIEVVLLDEEVPVVECETALDIVILNDVSGSVDAIEYEESKQFFVDFLTEVNIGTGTDESRAAIVEWSNSGSQTIKTPMTDNINALQTYLNDTRAFSGGTSPHSALSFGEAYLKTVARDDVEKVLILSTDGSNGQISSSLIALADEYKAQGYHIISIAFDNAFSNPFTRNILRQVASIDALAPGAPAYSLLDENLAQQIVFNYLCPIDLGSSATAYFNRDGAIDIVEISPENSCPLPEFVDITFDISAHRELSIPAGTFVTFYHNNPFQAGATKILNWQIPCAIPIESTERFSVTLPMEGPSNIFAVLNDDGVQGAPIDFPITLIDEIAYTNNIDNARVCLDTEATIQALKYSALPIPACDTLVTYTINVCNISEVDAFGVSVEDMPPSGFVLTGQIFNDNGCATDQNGTYDIPSDCCLSLTLTYDAKGAEFTYYGDQDVILSGPGNQTYLDFDGSTTTDEDVTLDGTIDCPSTNISFTKSVNIDESCDDGFVEFTFTITNEMNIPLQGLTFTDVLPDPCTWAYLPYGENGLSIANPMSMGREAIFTIDEVGANTVATFRMDASLNFWSADGTLNNSATLGNVPDVINGGFKTLTSNTTTTQITASPNITLPDTIFIDSGNDSINLEALLSTFADVEWTTGGDGEFSEINNQNTAYIFGEEDHTNKEVSLFISASSVCNETGASVIVIISECSDNGNLEIQLAAEGLSCGVNQVEIMVSSSIELDNVLWSGPSDEGLIGFNLLISEPGEYKVIGYAGNCQDSVTINIEESLADRMESYTICEGEQLIINNETYENPGMYEQILTSISDCDTILYIDLEVLENTMGEETYILTSGEILDINGTQYDAEGQYMQDLIGSNGCDSTLIINIIEDLSPLITFDFDDCSAWIPTMHNADYSEFTPFYNRELDCGNVTSSYIYREDPFENKHSCTEGLNDSYSMCISSETSCDFDINSSMMVRIDIEIDPNPNSEIFLTAIDFYQQAPENFSWISGDSGVNNYPTLFGIRILKDGDEIYFEENIPTALMWKKEVYNFSGNDNFIFTEAAELEIQLLPYCPIGVDSPVTAWDLEDLKIFGSCPSLNESKKVVAGTVTRHHNQFLDDVQILLSNGSEANQAMVDNQGKYAFLENSTNRDFTITANKDDDHLNGVNSYDLLMIQQHLLGIDPLDDPLQHIAADVNYDGKISTQDVRDLRDLILGISTEFPSNDSYRFLNKNEMKNDNHLWWELPENIVVQNLSNHILNADFVPVKIGDVTDQNNGNALDTNASAIEISESLHSDNSNTDPISKSSTIFKISKPSIVNGIHFSIDLNSLNFEGVESDLQEFSEENYHLTNEGILNISWTNAASTTFISSELFTLKFSETHQSNNINRVLISEIHTLNKKHELGSYDIAGDEGKPSISNLIVYPNPVNHETTISFEQETAQDVVLSIQNLEGKIVYRDILNTINGLNKIPLPENVMLQNNGIFILRLTNDSKSLIEKIMILE